MKRLIAGAALAVLLTACGGSDGGSSDDPQDGVADIVMQAAAEAGASPDEDCVRDAAAKIDDTEAQALVDAGVGGDPDISAETGEHLANMMLC